MHKREDLVHALCWSLHSNLNPKKVKVILQEVNKVVVLVSEQTQTKQAVIVPPREPQWKVTRKKVKQKQKVSDSLVILTPTVFGVLSSCVEEVFDKSQTTFSNNVRVPICKSPPITIKYLAYRIPLIVSSLQSLYLACLLTNARIYQWALKVQMLSRKIISKITHYNYREKFGPHILQFVEIYLAYANTLHDAIHKVTLKKANLWRAEYLKTMFDCYRHVHSIIDALSNSVCETKIPQDTEITEFLTLCNTRFLHIHVIIYILVLIDKWKGICMQLELTILQRITLEGLAFRGYRCQSRDLFTCMCSDPQNLVCSLYLLKKIEKLISDKEISFQDPFVIKSTQDINFLNLPDTMKVKDK